MNRYLDFFDPTIASAIERPLEAAYARGARKVLLIGTPVCRQIARNHIEKLGFSWVEQDLGAFERPAIANNHLVVMNSEVGADVSRALHACIGSNVEVIAPVTDHHISKRTVFLMSIPKAGTHMLIRLLSLMGLERSPDRAPRPGTWSTPVGYEYHAPCRELLSSDWFSPVGRQLLFRSPAIFVYRNPLDILVSELDWFAKPEHAFSGYLNCCGDNAERLSQLIVDDSVMGNLRDRINRYTGWMNFGNVIPLSYEELVGDRGGGSDMQQLDSIWALQLKLHIPGSPDQFGKRIYDPDSATFSKGRIGRHAEVFRSEHFALFDSLPQDFMRALGYTKGTPSSSRVMELLHRPLVVKNLLAEVLYTPRLVREGLLGWNIVELAGQYFPVKQGEQIGSPTEALAFSCVHEGFMSPQDAANAALHSATEHHSALTTPPQDPGTTLMIEGFLGFNVIRHHGGWYGFDQAAGPLDIDSLDASAIEELKNERQCLTGESITDVKAEILKLVLQQRHFAETNHRLDELLSRIDAERLRSVADLNSLREQLAAVKNQQASTSTCSAATDQRLDELRSHIDAEGLRSANDLNTLHEQLAGIKEQQVSTSAYVAGTAQRLSELRLRVDAEQMHWLAELKSIHERLGHMEQQMERISLRPLAKLDHLMSRLFSLKRSGLD